MSIRAANECVCADAMHQGRCPNRHCDCRKGVPRLYRVQFIPIKHGTLIDMPRQPHAQIGFKPGRAGQREGWMVCVVAEDTKVNRPHRPREAK